MNFLNNELTQTALKSIGIWISLGGFYYSLIRFVVLTGNEKIKLKEGDCLVELNKGFFYDTAKVGTKQNHICFYSSIKPLEIIERD